MNAQIVTLIGILSAFIGGILGYGIKYFFEKKQQIFTANAEFKRIAYSEVISLLLETMSQTQLGELEKKDFIKKLNAVYEKCILYASPDVINALGDIMQHIFTTKNPGEADNKKLLMRITKLFTCMRTDIGLKNNELGEEGERLMRIKLDDYNKVFEESKIGE